MVFMKAKVKAKREQSSIRLKQYHATNRALKAIGDPDGDLVMPNQIAQGGRRIIDIKLFARKMWCSTCQIPLSLRNLEKEEQMGIASRFHVRCSNCLATTAVDSSNTVKDNTKQGRSLFAVNCKAAIGCIDSGVGHEQFNKLFSAVNLPTMSTETMKTAEERVGPSLIAVAEESCRQAITEEKQLTLRRLSSLMSQASLRSDSDDPDDPAAIPASSASSATPTTPTSSRLQSNSPTSRLVDITVKFDFGWDKRGSGFKYDSKSGRGSLIGNETNKVLGYQVYSKHCAMCSRGSKPQDHVCVKNFEGSSKAMEPAAAVKLCLENPHLDEAGVRVTALIGDRDSSTMAALRSVSNHHITKIVDLNHNIKGVNNALWDLKKTRKYKFLSADVINYLKRCVNYAIHQNKGDVPAVEAAIMNIKNHVFGVHDSCGEFCKAKGDPNYRYKHLPDSKPLSDLTFQGELEGVLRVQANQAEQLAPAGSSLQNESFNHMCNTRAPKARCYCGTKANEYRVCAAVSCKNNGADHIEKVFEKANLTPSTSDYRQKLERTRSNKAASQQRPEIKKRRLMLKLTHNQKTAGGSRAEGLTYCTGMGTVMERAAEATNADPAWLPEASTLTPTCAAVLVDIETSGLSTFASIVQIAAKCGDKTFSRYMLPTQNICPQAAAVTDLKVIGGKLYQRGGVVATVPEQQACVDFVAFLKQCSTQVALVGHNIINFDAPRIMKLFTSHGLQRELCNVVFGLVETLPIVGQGKMKKLSLLAATYLKGPEWKPLVDGAHDALVDCTLLGGLLEHFNKFNNLMEKVLPMRDFLERQAVLQRKKKIAPSLQGMLQHGISQNMIGKLALAGVTEAELLSEYASHGRKGLEVCLGVQLHGKPRVTTRKAIIDSIEKFIISTA